MASRYAGSLPRLWATLLADGTRCVTKSLLHSSGNKLGMRRLNHRDFFRDRDLFRARLFRNLSDVDLPREADLLKQPDAVPVRIDFIPLQAVARGNRMRVVIVVPAFAPGQQGDPPAVGGKVARGKAARAPGVGCGVDQPGGMQSDHGAQKNSPENE